jgi:two-component system response regulator
MVHHLQTGPGAAYEVFIGRNRLAPDTSFGLVVSLTLCASRGGPPIEMNEIKGLQSSTAQLDGKIVIRSLKPQHSPASPSKGFSLGNFQTGSTLPVPLRSDLLDTKESFSPILLVDDVPEDLVLAQRALRRCKILNPIHVFPSGQECLDFFSSLSEKDALPSILFLDLVMSPLSGLDVLRALRSHKAGRDALVVMLSGMGDLKAVHEGYQLGAQTFLVKPLNSEDILQLVASLPRRLRCEKASNGYIIHPLTTPPSPPPGHGQSPERLPGTDPRGQRHFADSEPADN